MKRDGSDKYGRGSAAANGDNFVDLEPGDTFDNLEAQLRVRISEVFVNQILDISATIGSNRNANELAKHLSPGEGEEVHKFAAKNIGALFERGTIGFRHFDKKASPLQRWRIRFIRVFSSFVFAGTRFLATITLKENSHGDNFYSVEAVDITKGTCSERTPRGAMSKDLNAAPFLEHVPLLEKIISYYVGERNLTRPEFVNRLESFSIPRTAELLASLLNDTLNLHLRRAEPRDMRAVFKLSNDPVVRANSIHAEPIAWETHVAWFNKSVTNPEVVFLVAETDTGEFIGQIRFNHRGDDWVASISMVPAFRGRGLAKKLLLDAMKSIPQGRFLAEIADTNEASKRLFISAGYRETLREDIPAGFRAFTREPND